jgi:hypothetical protein
MPNIVSHVMQVHHNDLVLQDVRVLLLSCFSVSSLAHYFQHREKHKRGARATKAGSE